MTRLPVLLLALLTLLLTPARAEGPAPAPAKRALLWEVRTEGARVLLHASMHFPLSAVGPLPPAVTSALAASQAVYAPLTAAEFRGMNARLLAHGMRYPRTLPQTVPAPLYARFQALLAARGLPGAFYARMRPWMVAGLLLVIDHPSAGRMDRMMLEAIDAEAQRLKLPVSALETVDQQIAAFEALSEADQVAFLEAAVLRAERAAKAGRKVSDDLLAAYAAGDAEQVRASLTSCVPAGEAGTRFRRTVLESRAARVADRIRAEARGRPGGTLFVHADATIVLGEQGILAHLAKVGCEVKPAP